MKNLRTVLTCVCFTLYGLSATAQVQKSPLNEPDLNKPLLFAGLPDRIPVSIEYINSLFDSPSGRSISLATSADPAATRFEGSVLSSGSEDSRIQSVVISSTNFQGARFTVSKVTTEKGVKYTGRIISFKHGDAYQLKDESGNLVLVKRTFYSLVNE